MKTYSSRPWKSRAAAQLLARSGARDVQGAVSLYVSSLRRRAEENGFARYNDGPPYDPTALALALGVARVALQPLDCDGQIRLEDERLVVELNAGTPSRGRRRFTIAHEVGHLVLWEVCGGIKRTPERRHGSGRTSEIERLCDTLAAEILAPRTEIRELWSSYSNQEGPLLRTAQLIVEVEKRYAVSLHFAAVRVREVCSPRVGVALLNLDRQRVEWQVGIPAIGRAWKTVMGHISSGRQTGSDSYWEPLSEGVRTRVIHWRKIRPGLALASQM